MPIRKAGLFAPSRDWDALKRAYEAHTGDLADLAVANSIQPRTLRDYARKFGWVRPASAGVATGAVARPKPAGAPTGAVRVTEPTEASRAALVARLRGTIMFKLQQLEASMETSDGLSPADHERQSRALGTLVRNLEVVDDLGRCDGSAGGGKPGHELETASHDEEQLRRELAARIQRLRERLAR